MSADITKQPTNPLSLSWLSIKVEAVNEEPGRRPHNCAIIYVMACLENMSKMVDQIPKTSRKDFSL